MKRSKVTPLSPDIRQLIEKASIPQELEALGNTLSADQIQDALLIIANDKAQEWKLQPVLVGIKHTAFSQLLLKLEPSLRQIFIKMSASEPLQHHLSVFCHELLQFSEEADKQILLVQGEIRSLQPEELQAKDLQAIERAIAHFKKDYADELVKIENALSIAWNSDRSELIDRLGTFNEQFQRVSRDVIGLPCTETGSATGLYELLERRLAQVFDDKQSPGGLDTLRDDEPGIEALAKLSIWYIKDYWAVGLLPKIKAPGKLELSSLQLEAMNNLRHEARENLSKLGLGTVGDFKRLGIFSKSMLADYISKHSQKLR